MELSWSGQVGSGQVRSGQVRSGQVRSGQVRSGQVRLGYVSLEEGIGAMLSERVEVKFGELLVDTGDGDGFDVLSVDILPVYVKT